MQQGLLPPADVWACGASKPILSYHHALLCSMLAVSLLLLLQERDIQYLFEVSSLLKTPEMKKLKDSGSLIGDT